MTEANAAPSNVKLPGAVAAQVAEANRLIADLNTRPAEAVSASGQRWVAGSTGQPAPGAPSAAMPGSAGNPPPPPAAAAAAPSQPSTEERLRIAEARYASLQGKYNTETAMLREQVRENSQLVGQLLERATPPAPAVPAAPQSPEDFMRSLGASDAEIKDYGELLPIVIRLAQNMYQPTLKKLEDELTKLRNAAAQSNVSIAETRRAAILSALDAVLPHWRAINESDHFLDWLKVHDIFAGVSRHVALSSAFKNLDQARVVGIFEAYAREYPEQARAPGAPAVDPVTLVAPGTRGDQPPAAPEGSGAKRIYSESEIRAFYARVRKKQVGREEYQRFQAEVAVAAAEGRIRPDRPDLAASR